MFLNFTEQELLQEYLSNQILETLLLPILTQLIYLSLSQQLQQLLSSEFFTR